MTTLQAQKSQLIGLGEPERGTEGRRSQELRLFQRRILKTLAFNSATFVVFLIVVCLARLL